MNDKNKLNEELPINKKEELKQTIKTYDQRLKVVSIIFAILCVVFFITLIALSVNNEEAAEAFVWIGISVFIIFVILLVGLAIPKETVQKQLNKISQDELDIAKAKEKSILKTKILSAALKKDKDDAFNRGAVGTFFFGTAGAVVGTSSANEINFTTFLIIYTDETRETKEVENGSELYNYYIQYLEV